MSTIVVNKNCFVKINTRNKYKSQYRFIVTSYSNYLFPRHHWHDHIHDLMHPVRQQAFPLGQSLSREQVLLAGGQTERPKKDTSSDNY